MTLARHYRTLGLRRGSSIREIKAAYRQLVRRYHPDINPDQQAVEQFIEINDAYTALSAAIHTTAKRTQTLHRQPSRAKAYGGYSTKAVPKTQTTPSHSSEPLNLENFSLESLKLQLEKLGIGKFSHPQKIDATKIDSIEDSAEPQHAEESTNSDEFSTQEIQTSASIPTVKVDPEQEASLKQDAYLQLKKLLKQQKYPRAVALVEGLAHRMPTDSEISQWQAIVYQRWGRLLISQGQPQKARIYLKKALRTDPNNPSLWSEVNRDFWLLANLGKLESQSSPAL